MKTTMFTRNEDVKRTFYLLDATDIPVGRVASMAAYLLRGKHRPDYTPHIDNGDHVVIVNADKVALTGSKWDDKVYYRHSMFLGGLKETTARKMRETHPDRILHFAVKGMLPKNRLGNKLIKKLAVYAGSEHPHEAQNPTAIEISKDKHIIKIG